LSNNIDNASDFFTFLVGDVLDQELTDAHEFLKVWSHIGFHGFHAIIPINRTILDESLTGAGAGQPDIAESRRHWRVIQCKSRSNLPFQCSEKVDHDHLALWLGEPIMVSEFSQCLTGTYKRLDFWSNGLLHRFHGRILQCRALATSIPQWCFGRFGFERRLDRHSSAQAYEESESYGSDPVEHRDLSIH
jgi:hypothetical protein